MALMLDLRVTVRAGGTERIEVLEIQRLTALHSPSPADEIHRYVARIYGGETLAPRLQTEFTHRYGDGPWRCALLALQALDLGKEARLEQEARELHHFETEQENARLRQVLADIGVACDLVDTETTEATQGWLVDNIQALLENASRGL